MSKLYTRFSPDHDFSKTDYIVIGSGVGGLTAAIFLAKAGKKVIVLERHYVPGGFSHTFKRKNGFEWDVGVHYVGNLDEEKSQLKVIFNYLSDNKLNWEYMGEVYDKFIIDKDEYIFTSGKENLRKQLYSYFPNEKKAIDAYLQLVEKAAVRSNFFFAEKVFPPFLRYTLGKFFKKLFKPYYSRTTYEVLKEITGNEKLISVLCAQCGNYGLPPSRSSFAAHAVVVNHFMEGGYYPIGGASQIYKTMIATLYNHGGKVFINSEVEDIVVENNKVKGIHVNGTFIACKNVISNAGANNTYSHLLKDSLQRSWQEELKDVNPSMPHMCLYVGLDRSDADLKLTRNNIWFYKNYKIDELLESSLESPDTELKFAYISFPSAKDPAWEKSHPGTSTLQAIGVANYEWFKEFEDKPWMKRGEVYESIKERFKEKMLDKLYELYPQIKGHVVCVDVSTPLSTRHFMACKTGEIYGLEHTPERFDLTCLRPKTSIKGLYMVGQDIALVGIGGAIVSGILCAVEILKWSIYSQFRSMAKNNKGMDSH